MSGILDLSLATPMHPVTAATVVLDLSMFGKVVQVRIKAVTRPEWPTYFTIVIYSERPADCDALNVIDAEMFLRCNTPMTGEAARRALQAATNAAEALAMTPVV